MFMKTAPRGEIREGFSLYGGATHRMTSSHPMSENKFTKKYSSI
jgi:hypothetical protein